MAASWEANRFEAFRLTQDYGGPDAPYVAASALATHPAVKAHIADALNWLSTAGVGDDPSEFEPLTEEEFADLFGKAGRPPRIFERSGD